MPALQQGDLLTELLEKNGGKGTSWQYLTFLEKDDEPCARHSQTACRSSALANLPGGLRGFSACC